MSAFSFAGEGKSFSVRFNACTREPLPWREEVYAAARAIHLKAKKPIWVCSSGGIDSEVACRAFYDQDIPFSVLTLEHREGTNAHDIRFAVKWCEERGVSQKIVPIDMERFLTEDIEKYAERYIAIHPFRYFQLKLLEIVEEMGGFAVLCSGEQIYHSDMSKKVLTRSDMVISVSNGTAMPLAWCTQHKTEHEPYFHFATPELCLSYIRQPLISFALDNPEYVFRHPVNTYALKRMAYLSAWPDMEGRFKYHGYERLKEGLFQHAYDTLHKKFADRFVRVDIPVDEFERQLLGA